MLAVNTFVLEIGRGQFLPLEELWESQELTLLEIEERNLHCFKGEGDYSCST